MVSLGTFFVGITLTRSLSPEQYGAYAIIFGVLMFLDIVHTAIVQFPLMTRGANVSRDELGRITAKTLLWALVVALPLTLLIGCVTVVVSDARDVPLVILALLAWQLQETVRQSLAAHLRHRDMLLGDGVKFGGWVLLVWLLVWTEQISIGTVFGALWITSMLAFLVQYRQVRVRFIGEFHFRSIARHSWQLGRFVFVTYVLGTLLFYVFPWSLSIADGLEATAKLQALLLVLGVLNPVMYGMNSILIPVVARTWFQSGVAEARRASFGYGALGGALMLPYLLVVLAAPSVVLSIFFGASSPYADQTAELRLMSLVFMTHYTTIVFQATLNGVQKVLPAALSQSLATIVAVVVGIPLLVHWDVMGAGIAWLASLIVLLSMQFLYLWFPDVMPWSRTWTSEGSQEPAAY